MKILISYPPLRGPGTPMLGQNRQFQWFSNPSHIYPMVPASAATLLAQNGFEVEWQDCIATGQTEAEFWTYLETNRPDLIALETKSPVVKQHWQLIDRLRDRFPDLITVLMGDHVTALPEESLVNSQVGYVLVGGDYDFSLLALCCHLRDGANLPAGFWYRGEAGAETSGAQNQTPHDLDSLPYIDRTLTNWQLYGEKLYKRKPFTYTMAGRDCPYGRCTFCSWTTLYPRFRVRSPENLVDEIDFLVRTLGVRELFDDTGTFPSGNWLERFCSLMRDRGLHKQVKLSCNFRYDYLTAERAKMMKASGFRLMKMGLESANQPTLDRLRKGTSVEDIHNGCRWARDAGLEVHLTMMLGYPWENRVDALRTVTLAEDLMNSGMASMLQATVVTPYPGTPLFKEAVENGWLRIAPDDYEKLDMDHGVLSHGDMSEEEVSALCGRIYRSFLNPRYILHQLMRIRDLDDIWFYLRGVKPVAGHLRDFGRKTFLGSGHKA